MRKHTLPLVFLFVVVSSRLCAQLPSVQEVYIIFQAKCASCHDHASPEAGLDLEGSGANAYQRAVNVAQNLTNVAPLNAHALAGGLKRVYPGRPDRSFLFRKINAGLEPTVAALHPEEGAIMPNSPGANLTGIEKEIIRQWILYGAKTSGTQFDKTVVENFYNLGGEKAFPDGPPPAPAPGEGFQVKMGPFYLAPSGEVEYYQKYELQLPENVEVNRLTLQMSGYSHHFIVYNFTGNGAAVIPHGLRLDANHNDINLVAAVQEQTDLKLPATTAFKWDKNIVLDLNSHYINYSAAFPYQCEAYLNVYTQPSGTAEQEMYAALLVNPFIPIPNNGNLITHSQAQYQFGADSIYIWGLMGHTHKYGRSYKAWRRQPNGQKGELIYDASCPFGTPGCPSQYFDYRHIPLRYWEPLLPLKWGDGLIHEATWVNEGPTAVNFGPTSDDEMMVLIAFYTLNPVTVDADEPWSDKEGKAIRVSPNPAREAATFALPEGMPEVRLLRIFNASGQIALERREIGGPSFDLDLAGLAPGIYFYNADGQTGKISIIR